MFVLVKRALLLPVTMFIYKQNYTGVVATENPLTVFYTVIVSNKHII